MAKEVVLAPEWMTPSRYRNGAPNPLTDTVSVWVPAERTGHRSAIWRGTTEGTLIAAVATLSGSPKYCFVPVPDSTGMPSTETT